jgi:hypothetical protein
MILIPIVFLAIIPVSGQTPHSGMDGLRSNSSVPLPVCAAVPEAPIVASDSPPAQAAAGRFLASFIRPGMTMDQVRTILGNPDGVYGTFHSAGFEYSNLCIHVICQDVRKENDKLIFVVTKVIQFIPKKA